MRAPGLLKGAAVALAVGTAWVLLARGDRPPGSGSPHPGGPAGPARAAPTSGGGGASPGDAGPGVEWGWSAVVDTGGGHVGPWRMNRSDWRYVDDPTVALDDVGGTYVAWVDQERKDVVFRRYDAGGEPVLDEPVNVSGSPDVFSWLPRMLVGGDGSRVHLLWQEIVFSGGTHGGEAFFARSTDGGRTFGDPVNLSETTAGAGKGRLGPRRWHNGSLDLTAGPDGTLHAAWTVYEGGLWAARSEDGGETFSEPLRVSERGSEPARAPALAARPRGEVHLVWAVGEDPAADLRWARSDDGGRSFTAPRALFEDEARADAPAVAASADGALHLVWAETPGGRPDGGRVRHARASPGGEGFDGPRTLAGPEGEVAGVGFPSLALDGDGDPWVLWEVYPEGGERSRGLGLTASRDGGETFARPAVVPGTDDASFSVNGSLQGLLMRKLAVNGSGEIAVVNSDFEFGEASRVLVVRGRATAP